MTISDKLVRGKQSATSRLPRRRRTARLFCFAGSIWYAVMTMGADGTALLIMFAATLVLVHAEIYFSHPLTMQHCMSDVF